MIVTISGKPGSGKSTVAKALADRLGLAHRSAGELMREMAAERGMSVLALSAIAESDGGAIDREIDQRTRELGDTEDDFVIDSRLAWHFIPSSVKVFLEVGIEVSAARIYGQARGAEVENTDLLATISAVERRLTSETARYRQYYGIDWLNKRHYDLIVDTSALDVTAVVDQIQSYLETRFAGRTSPGP